MILPGWEDEMISFSESNDMISSAVLLLIDVRLF